MEKYLKLKNKEFAFKCLDLIHLNKSFDEVRVKVLTDKNSCKSLFDMNYSILQEVNLVGSIDKECYLDTAGNRRYYPDTVHVNGKRYIVCNDWYYGERRDTRTKFLQWCMQSNNK